jgi:hypothetical protein
MKLESEQKFRLPLRKLAKLVNMRVAGAKMGDRTERDLVSTYSTARNASLAGMVLRSRNSRFND